MASLCPIPCLFIDTNVTGLVTQEPKTSMAVPTPREGPQHGQLPQPPSKVIGLSWLLNSPFQVCVNPGRPELVAAKTLFKCNGSYHHQTVFCGHVMNVYLKKGCRMDNRYPKHKPPSNGNQSYHGS